MAEDTITLTRAEYDALIEQLEDLQASLALERARKADDGAWTPGEVVDAIYLHGHHPLAAWRVYRRMTVPELAAASGIGVAEITALEAGKTPGTPETYSVLARALQAPLAAVMPDCADDD